MGESQQAPVFLRVASPTDASGVATVHRLSRASYYGLPVGPDADDGREEMWAALVAQPGRVTYVAESTGIVGFVSMAHVREPLPALELTGLYVLPTHFGRGTGARLYGEFERERSFEEAGVLEVWSGNARAIRFYEQRGWRGTDTARPGPQGRDFVTYRLPVVAG